MPAPVSKPRKKNFLDVKWLLLSGALVSTLGFWGIFTKLDAKTQASAVAPDPSQNPDTTGQPANTLVLQLPPMPTLIAPANISVAASSQAPVIQAPAAVQVSAPAAPRAPVKILMGGSKPGRGGSASAPVARTGSSR